MRLPFLPPIDAFSFWFGFACAALIFGLLWMFRAQLSQLREDLADRLRALRERLTSGTERNLREDLINLAQKSHLAGALFPVDAVLLPPRFWRPDGGFDPTQPAQEEDLNAIIPLIPEWPQLAAIYRAPTISLDEALAGEASVVVLGAPGSGKTTLLMHLISRLAQADEDGDPLFPGNVTPIYAHAGDLDFAPPEAGEPPGPRGDAVAADDPARPLIAAAQKSVAALTAARLPRHLQLRLSTFKCAIFLDGLDEMLPAQIAEIAAWLGRFRKHYPAHRVVAAAGLIGYGPLTAAGLAPIFLAPWTDDDYRALIAKWGEPWRQAQAKRRRPAAADVDAHIIMGWLQIGNRNRSLFEVTLKIWAAFAGDARGSRPIDWLESLVVRAGLKPDEIAWLNTLALAVLGSEWQYGAPRATLAQWCDDILKSTDGRPAPDSDDFLDRLVSKKILVKRRGDVLAFGHPLVQAYCAGLGLAAQPASAEPGRTPLWERALYFFAPLGDLLPVVGRNLQQKPDVVQSEQLMCAQWLRDSSPQTRWRVEVFRRLSRLALDTNLPENLRLRALGGFIAANDASAAALFKQALTNTDPFNRRLGALGLGALGDVSAVPQLAALFSDPYLDVRWAAALALAQINSEAAIDALTKGLLGGDDDLRQGCAQALARNREIGHARIKEAATHQDLGVRRAAVYGLAAIGEAWAVRQIEKMQTDEPEWFVRSAAVEMVSRLSAAPERRAARPVTPPESQGWLIEWAASKGTGVPPGKGAIEILNRALKEGDEPIRIAAADSLARLADPLAARELYNALRDPEHPLVRDAAYRGLAYIAAATGQRMAMAVN